VSLGSNYVRKMQCCDDWINARGAQTSRRRVRPAGRLLD
jgi:hypothetical protein